MSKNYAFNRGFNQVSVGNAPLLKEELMKALKIKSRAAWIRRINGQVDPKVSEINSVETVFAKYGIKQVWGE
ncbi:hypothetical protein JZU61_04505 [bacterium]|jgi:hypothetical protein|nr:hypothetical protein [bacterium]